MKNFTPEEWKKATDQATKESPDTATVGDVKDILMGNPLKQEKILVSDEQFEKAKDDFEKNFQARCYSYLAEKTFEKLPEDTISIIKERLRSKGIYIPEDKLKTLQDLEKKDSDEIKAIEAYKKSLDIMKNQLPPSKATGDDFEEFLKKNSGMDTFMLYELVVRKIRSIETRIEDMELQNAIQEVLEDFNLFNDIKTERNYFRKIIKEQAGKDKLTNISNKNLASGVVIKTKQDAEARITKLEKKMKNLFDKKLNNIADKNGYGRFFVIEPKKED